MKNLCVQFCQFNTNNQHCHNKNNGNKCEKIIVEINPE